MSLNTSILTGSRCGLLCGLFLLSLISPSRAEPVFAANLSTMGGGAQLQLGRIYFRTTGTQMEFLAVMAPLPLLTGALNPLLQIPEAAVEFSLGSGSREWLHGTRTVADQNPFLPAPPWEPHSYDEAGNPLYLDSPVIREMDVFRGSFTLPVGFLDDLLAGQGRIRFNANLGGDLVVAVVPEPAVGTLLMLSGVGALAKFHRRSRKPQMT